MNYLIKIFIFIILSLNVNASENQNNKIVFTINQKVFTDVDIEKRNQYIGQVNNLDESSDMNLFFTLKPGDIIIRELSLEGLLLIYSKSSI